MLVSSAGGTVFSTDGGGVTNDRAVTLVAPPAPTVRPVIGVLCALGALVRISWQATPPAKTVYYVETASGANVGGPFTGPGSITVTLQVLTSYRLTNIAGTWRLPGPAAACS